MTAPQTRAPYASTGLIAAAMVARDGRYSIRVLLPYPQQQILEAAEAAEQAGVDLAVHRTRDSATVHFVARHQDRSVSLDAVRNQRCVQSSAPLRRCGQ